VRSQEHGTRVEWGIDYGDEIEGPFSERIDAERSLLRTRTSGLIDYPVTIVCRSVYVEPWAAATAVDWASEFDAAADAHGWRRLGQPQRWGRRYGRGNSTVRVYWDSTSSRVARASVARFGYTMTMVIDETAADYALRWLCAVSGAPAAAAAE
jgi:hypothetical protein